MQAGRATGSLNSLSGELSFSYARDSASFALHMATIKREEKLPSSMNHFYFHHRMNFPSCRAPRLMKSISAEPLNRPTHLCAAVVLVLPQEITSHPHFLCRVSRCPVARIL